MAFGSLKFHGIGLGTAGVLFAGILVGHFGEEVDHATLDFVKEFGLILFVFCIGLQIGPGFFASLRQSGLRLNSMALSIVLLGGLISLALGWLFGFDSAGVPGIFSGATTNTPSLGAAQQTLITFPDISDERAALPALALVLACYLGESGGDGIHLLGPLSRKVVRVAPPLVITEAEARQSVDLMHRLLATLTEDKVAARRPALLGAS